MDMDTIYGVGIHTAANGIAFDSTHDRMYVTIFENGNVLVIDTKNNTVIDEISIGSRPVEIAFDSLNDRMYVANTNYSISVIYTKNNTVIDEIPVYGGNPLGIAFDSTNDRMYVTKLASTISVIDTKNNTVIDEIPHSDHSRMVFDPLHNRIYIAGFFNNTLSILDVKNNTITDKISIDSTVPWNIAFDSKHNRVYVGDSGLYSVVDTNNNRVIKTIEIN
jgi:YVTN family beta-propeller protein